MVPVDEPLDLKNPPVVFISYQWGVQEKAKALKDYLTNAGFSSWLDIGEIFLIMWLGSSCVLIVKGAGLVIKFRVRIPQRSLMVLGRAPNLEMLL